MEYLKTDCQAYYTSVTSVAEGSANSWHGLHQQSTILGASPALVTLDGTNDYIDHAYRSMEALIRLIWTANPQTRLLGWMHPKFSSNDDAAVETPINQDYMDAIIALYEHYGIPYLDYWTLLKQQISGGHHLSEYYDAGDPVHPLEAGHDLIFSLIRPYLPTGGATLSGALPARLYDNGDLEYPPTHKLGTAYDSITGSWTTTGSRISSSDTSATVTYSATCCTFALYRSDLLTNTVDVSIDGGAYQTLAIVSDKVGVDIGGVRAAHTITVRPKTGACIIDEFRAI